MRNELKLKFYLMLLPILSLLAWFAVWYMDISTPVKTTYEVNTSFVCWEPK